MYENVTFTDIVSCDVIDNDKQATTEIVVTHLISTTEKEKYNGS